VNDERLEPTSLPVQGAATVVDPGVARRFLSGLCNCGDRPSAPARGCGCVAIRDTPIERPDLAIYSQLEEIAASRPPSWDSPDIVTNDWGPFRLRTEASVKVRNLSGSTFAANARVHYYTSPFGIGTRRTLRLTRVVSLAPSSEVDLVFPLTQELLSGDPRTGVHIVIEHPTDERPINNAGSQVHDGGFTTESGRSFSVAVPVVNDTGVSRRIDLAVLPTDLVASVAPLSHVFGPYEQIVATLAITVPPFIVGSPAIEISRAVTVIGRMPGGELVGGATRLLRINS
jgi:hypothetical protein